VEPANRKLWSRILFGLGLVGFIDETVFHQLLHWHHFYDKSTTQIGLISDGLFHAFSWFVTVGSLFMFADLRGRKALYLKRWVGGILLGAGFSNYRMEQSNIKSCDFTKFVMSRMSSFTIPYGISAL
jgi:uncharacterized membrane protein